MNNEIKINFQLKYLVVGNSLKTVSSISSSISGNPNGVKNWTDKCSIYKPIIYDTT